MDQNIILKSEPRLEISLAENGFEILDDSTPNNNGTYSYVNIKSVELNKDWFSRLVIGLPISLMALPIGIFKNKSYLKITLDKRVLKLWLSGANMDKAETIKYKLSEKKPTHNKAPMKSPSPVL